MSFFLFSFLRALSAAESRNSLSPDTADYAVAIFGGFHLLGGIYWFFGGKKRTHAVHEAKLEAEGEGSELSATE